MMFARRRKILVFFITFFITVAVDQVTKALVTALMLTGRSVTLIPHVLSITHTTNKGAAFGLFAGSRQIVFWSAIVVVAIMLIWFYRAREQKNVWSLIALGLMIGGAVGNLVDRIFRGRIVDFIDLGWWPVFNIADIAIVAGVIMLVVVMVLDMADRGAKENAEPGGE